MTNDSIGLNSSQN